MSENKIFVTGGNGYVGSWIARTLAKTGFQVIAGSRSRLPETVATHGLDNRVYGDLTEDRDWSKLLDGVRVLVHTAGFVHRREPLSDSDAGDALKLNELLVRRVTTAAVEAKVEHVILISTIAVHGSDSPGTLVIEESPLRPDTTYARTKLAGERELIECCRNTNTAWTIIRPTMIYGHGCPGNFSSLVRAVRARIPLPLRSVRNARSLLYIRNLAELITLVIKLPKARDETFVVADPGPVSTPEIIRWVSEGLGVKPLLWPFPVALLRRLSSIVGYKRQLTSLVDNYAVDPRKAIETLGWQPSFNTHGGILDTFRVGKDDT